MHLVDHQQPVLLVAQRAHRLQVLGAHRVHAAFALNRFHEHRDHVRVADGGLAQGVDVVQRHADEAFDQRLKTLLNLFIAGRAERGDAAAVKGLFVDHDFRPRNAFFVTKLARQLQRRLVGFQAGAAEEHIAHARQLHQLGREALLVRHMVVVAAVDDLGNLVLQRRHQLSVVVAQRVHGNATQRIQVLTTLGVPDAAALAMGQRDRQAAVGVHRVRRCGCGHGGLQKNAALQLGRLAQILGIRCAVADDICASWQCVRGGVSVKAGQAR